MKTCYRCKKKKEENLFYLRKKPNGESYRCSVCYECRNKYEVHTAKASLRNYLLQNMRSRRWFAKKKEVDFTVSFDYLQKLFLHQEGKCAYTKEELDYKINKRVSLDRWDNSKGYIEGNILYCTTRANEIKSNQSLGEFKDWMPKWYKRGKKIIEGFKHEE